MNRKLSPTQRNALHLIELNGPTHAAGLTQPQRKTMAALHRKGYVTQHSDGVGALSWRIRT